MARGAQLKPLSVGDEVGGYKILRVGEDHSSKNAQTYHVERTCECQGHLQVTHAHIIHRRNAGVTRCRECAMARLSYQQTLDPPRRVWTREMDANLQDWAGVLPARVIAAKVGVGADSVYRRARYLGLTLRRRPIDLRQEVLSLVEQGRTRREVAAQLNLPVSTVSMWIHRYKRTPTHEHAPTRPGGSDARL